MLIGNSIFINKRVRYTRKTGIIGRAVGVKHTWSTDNLHSECFLRNIIPGEIV